MAKRLPASKADEQSSQKKGTPDTETKEGSDLPVLTSSRLCPWGEVRLSGGQGHHRTGGQRLRGQGMRRNLCVSMTITKEEDSRDRRSRKSEPGPKTVAAHQGGVHCSTVHDSQDVETSQASIASEQTQRL